MSKEFVYILTNPCLDGWVKIGRTNNIHNRLRELNHPANIPLSFRAYAAYETEEAVLVEQSIHKLIDNVNGELRATEVLENGRTRTREFFRISPEKAYQIFSIVAALRGESCALRIYEPGRAEKAEEEIQEKAKLKRKNLTFDLIQIPVGTELTFLYDDSITCTTADTKNRVSFGGESYTVSGLAAKLLVERCGWRDGATAHGGKYFLVNSETLTDRRERMEREEGEDAGESQ